MASEVFKRFNVRYLECVMVLLDGRARFLCGPRENRELCETIHRLWEKVRNIPTEAGCLSIEYISGKYVFQLTPTKDMDLIQIWDSTVNLDLCTDL